MLDGLLPGFISIFGAVVSWMRATILIGNMSIFTFFVLVTVFSIVFAAFINGANSSKGGNDSDK